MHYRLGIVTQVSHLPSSTSHPLFMFSHSQKHLQFFLPIRQQLSPSPTSYCPTSGLRNPLLISSMLWANPTKLTILWLVPVLLLRTGVTTLHPALLSLSTLTSMICWLISLHHPHCHQGLVLLCHQSLVLPYPQKLTLPGSQEITLLWLQKLVLLHLQGLNLLQLQTQIYHPPLLPRQQSKLICLGSFQRSH